MLTLEMSEQSLVTGGPATHRPSTGRRARSCSSPGPLAGWGGGVWVKTWRMFQMRRAGVLARPRVSESSCVTSGKLHFTSLDLVSSSAKWGKFICGREEAEARRGWVTCPGAHSCWCTGTWAGLSTSWCSPSQSFPGPCSLSSSRPGAPIHPAVSSALAGFALGVPTSSVAGKSHTRMICFLFIDSARRDAGHRVRV